MSNQEVQVPRSFGALHVYSKDRGFHEFLKVEVTRMYASIGLERVNWLSPQVLIHAQGGPKSFSEPTIQSLPMGQSDEVFVSLHAPDDAWFVISSRHWELAPIGKHPLAEVLSQQFEVLSISSVKDHYFEVSLYANGKCQQLSVFGEAPEALPQLPDIDLSWFIEREAFATTEFLEELLAESDWEEFLLKIGHDWLGYVDAFEGAPLYDYSPDMYLVFAENTKEIEKKMSTYIPEDDEEL